MAVSKFRLCMSALALIMFTEISDPANAQVKNIVLIHGAFADGSGWEKIYEILKAKGYNVNIIGNPDTGVPDDVAATQRVLDRQAGPVILVGHSYGGAIITAAGNDPKLPG